MLSLKIEQSIFLISAEKDALRLALPFTTESKDKDSLLALVDKVGMADGHIKFTSAQNIFLQREIPSVLSLNGIKGSKLDSAVAKDIFDSLLARLNTAFAE